SRLRVQVGWWHFPTEALIPAVDAQGGPLESVMLAAGGFVGAIQQPDLDLTATERATFGGAVALTGYLLDADRLTLAWEAVGVLDDDYTVFVQVVGPDGQVVGQGDAPPDLPTRYWRPGERYHTEHTLIYPQPPAAGRYRLLIGWYRPADFLRLSVAAPDDAYPLLTLDLPN
ncbi:MAG: hypothetical protein GYB67_16680, partial [Chloroflexi bacterium]|nr:hypothetical protein [Chloroflexota bacterium]